MLARQVVSIERFPALAAEARANLATAGLSQVTVVVGDGTLGVPEHAPYQAIVVAAASPRIPPPLVEQLAPGGRLVHPVGPGGHEQVTAFHQEADRLVADARLTPARFVPLVGLHGVSTREPGG
jgi:protein-L-isoaspartate(D-aspartate) O-methyltransferase